MEYRQLGSAGVRVSVIGLGANRFGSEVLPPDEVARVLDVALDLGINLIDTADAYTKGRSEEAIGEALQGRRDRFLLATKFYFPTGDGPNDRGASRHHIMNGVEASLQRMGTDYIDLYYAHRWDSETPIEETLQALDDLVRQGKVRYLGASAYAAWQLAHANLLAETRGWASFVVLQAHYHLLERSAEREQLPFCVAHGIGFIPYFPLAGGFLTGKYERGQPAPPGTRGESSSYVQGYMTDENHDRIERLTAWAAERGRGLNELAQAWLLAQPQVCSVITGATKVEHVVSNARAADWSLTVEEVEALNAILEGDEAEA